MNKHIDRHFHNGRWFQVLVRFPNTPDGTRQANAYMGENDHAAVLAVHDEIILADTRDTGTSERN